MAYFLRKKRKSNLEKQIMISESEQLIKNVKGVRPKSIDTSVTSMVGREHSRRSKNYKTPKPASKKNSSRRKNDQKSIRRGRLPLI